MEHRLDPLGDLEVKRVLAFARAREQYPSVPRGLLLDYCQAAWQAALAGGEDDVVGRFERALMLVAWTHRRSPHLSFRDLVDQVIPQVALRPFMAPADALPVQEPEPVVEAEPAVRPDAPRPPARRLIPRVPFASPIPLGAAVAAGFIGVTVLGQSGALPVAPFAPAGNDGASSSDGDGHHGAEAAAQPAARAAGGGASSEATGTPVGLAAAPQAAKAFRAPAVTSTGGAAAAKAPPAPAAPAQPVSAPAATPAAPAQPAPAAPSSAPEPVADVEQQVPDDTGVEELAQAPDEHPGNWKHEADAEQLAGVPAPAPAEPSPEPDATVPDTGGSAPGGDKGEKVTGHGRRSDRFEPIDLQQPTEDTGDQAAPPAPPQPAAVQPGPEADPQPQKEQQATPPLNPPQPAQVGPPPAPQQVGPPAAPPKSPA